MPKAKPRKRMTLPALVEQFSDETKCHAFLEALRWPEGVACPGRLQTDKTRAACGSTKISRLAERRLFECVDCGYQFSTRVGTIFEDSKLPLWKWFVAVFMMAESKKGVSAKQIERMLGISYKTAWYLCHRIRAAMFDENAQPLTGIIETDETLIGGKLKLSAAQGDKLANKSTVLGAVSRGGELRLRVAPNRRKPAIAEFFNEHISPDADAVYTDEFPVYPGLAAKRGVVHGSVNHMRKEWVHGQVHTNTIEGVFSLLDRSIIGAYHKVSKKHLHRYLHEVEWRYNNRRNAFLFRDAILELIGAERMEYKKLTA
jgi:transposase-like protein